MIQVHDECFEGSAESIEGRRVPLHGKRGRLILDLSKMCYECSSVIKNALHQMGMTRA